MSKYEDIINHLEKAEGPSHEIDAIIVSMDGFQIKRERNRAWRYGDRNTQKWYNIPSYTASLDAAVALVERMLPGWTIANIGQDDGKTWHAELRKGHKTSYSTVKLAGAAVSAIALLLALFRALQAQEESEAA